MVKFLLHYSTHDCRRATPDDLEAILAITHGETLYDGTDYLPIAMKPWLEEGVPVSKIFMQGVVARSLNRTQSLCERRHGRRQWSTSIKNTKIMSKHTIRRAGGEWGNWKLRRIWLLSSSSLYFLSIYRAAEVWALGHDRKRPSKQTPFSSYLHKLHYA